VTQWYPEGGASAVLIRHPDSAVTWQVAGAPERILPWASVTKLVTTLAVLIAVEEGSVALDDTIPGFDGVTLAHLLAHAGGIAADRPTQSRPAGTRRSYSNASIRLAADHVARRTELPFTTYVDTGVIEPLDLRIVWGDPAAGAAGTIEDLCRLGAQFLSPTLISQETLSLATRPWWPDLDGVVPGFGIQQPCPWGLGFEIKGAKTPHWMDTANHPDTFGHFGQSGSMIAIDPHRHRACCSLAPTAFGPWALTAWPAFCRDSLLG
jgi:CubicO group peptidase (beta-lactamase class C family)